MKLLSPKQKQWMLSKSRKRIRELSRRKRHTRRKHLARTKYDANSNSHRLVAPAVLSIDRNPSETLEYFSAALHTASSCLPKQSIYFDLKAIEYISADAIMYIIALVNNVKRVNRLRIRCEGNLPEASSARSVIEDVGFYEYVSGLKPTREEDSAKRFKITSEKDVDGAVIGKICDFVNECAKSQGKLLTKRLYPIIMELMTNTRQHAYRKESGQMNDNWYIYAENKSDSIEFVFLDTGLGIPSTIRKNFFEKIKVLSLANDASFIASALKGAFRTETEQSHRGKGLPEIYKDSKAGRISELTVVSGNGKCVVGDNGIIEETLLPVSFVGTLVCWKFLKQGAEQT